MRAFVFLLVLANLVFFAWAQGYFGQAESPDAVRVGQQIAPDRLLVLSRDRPPTAGDAEALAGGRPQAAGNPVANAAEVPAPAATAAEPAVVTEKCIAWAGLSAADADALEGALANERFSTLRRVRHSVPEIHSWWVFMPPLANKAEAERKAGELRRLGVSEYFVVQEAGPNRYAISLGVFSSEQAAEVHLNALRAKGVRSAKVGGRPGSKEGSVTIEASGQEGLLDAVAEAVRSTLPAARTTRCGQP